MNHWYIAVEHNKLYSVHTTCMHCSIVCEHCHGQSCASSQRDSEGVVCWTHSQMQSLHWECVQHSMPSFLDVNSMWCFVQGYTIETDSQVLLPHRPPTSKELALVWTALCCMLCTRDQYITLCTTILGNNIQKCMSNAA